MGATEFYAMAPAYYQIFFLPLMILGASSASTQNTGSDKLKEWHRSIGDMSYDGCWSDGDRNQYKTKGDNNGAASGICGCGEEIHPENKCSLEEEIFLVVDCASKGARWDYNFKVNCNNLRPPS